MYETQSQTNGLHRGFDECEMSQARCFAGGICRRVKAMTQACETKAPAPGCNQIRAMSEP